MSPAEPEGAGGESAGAVLAVLRQEARGFVEELRRVVERAVHEAIARREGGELPALRRPSFTDPVTGAELPDPLTRAEFCAFWPTSPSSLKRMLRSGRVAEVRFGRSSSAIPGYEFVRLREEGLRRRGGGDRAEA